MALPCPNCGADLRLIEEYGRLYCDACGQYAPDGYGGGKGLQCPKCGGVLTYVKDYDRYYCNKDQEYAPEELGREGTLAPEMPPAPEPEPEFSFDDLLPPEPETAPPSEAPPAETVPVETPPAEPTPAVPAAMEPATVAAPEPAAPAAEPRRAEEELAPEELEKEKKEKRGAIVVSRPPLVREEIVRAKKAVLMDLAAAYGLDTMGTKETLKERLLAESHRIEREEERRMAEEKRREEVAHAPSEPAPAPASVIGPGPAPVPVVTPPSEAPRAAEPSPEPAPVVTPPMEDRPAETPGSAPPAAIPEASVSASVVVPEPAPQEAPRLPTVFPEPAAEVKAGAPVAPEVPKVINPCPTCGRELAYIEQYDRYYCYHCKAYAPPVVKVVAVPAPPKVGKPCPTCGRELTYVPEYKRHYCYSCKKYAPLEAKVGEPATAATVVEVTPAPPAPAVAIPPPAVRNPCPTCGRELAYIERYGRYYCYSCRKYAPARPRHPCPNCGKELQFIAKYQRHYCPACGQYAPAELTRRILAERSAAAIAAPAVAARPAAVTRVITHEHASPAGGIVLAFLGLLLVLFWEFVWGAAESLGTDPVIALDPLAAWLVRLVGFLLIGLGVVVGLLRVRQSK